MRLKEILLATNNRHKASEIKKILNIKGLKILCLEDIKGELAVNENGRTFAQNALKKARATAKKFGITAVSDDSGLCVRALNGAPGVRSARFVAPPVTPERLCKKLLQKMKNVTSKDRSASFQCFVAVASPSGKHRVVGANCRGRIAFEMKGSGGFGYDPVFIPSGYAKTFAQMTAKQKNSLSHRGKAISRLRKIIESF